MPNLPASRQRQTKKSVIQNAETVARYFRALLIVKEPAARPAVLRGPHVQAFLEHYVSLTSLSSSDSSVVPRRLLPNLTTISASALNVLQPPAQREAEARSPAGAHQWSGTGNEVCSDGHLGELERIVSDRFKAAVFWQR